MVMEETEREGIKLLYDTFKHLTTLSTGSIVILATFLKDVFPNPEWQILSSVVFVLFLVSTISAVLVMLGYGELLRTKDDVASVMDKVAQYGIIISGLSFIGAVISLVVFTIKNLN